MEAGYGRCVYVSKEMNRATFHFPLTAKSLFLTTLSLHVFFIILAAPFEVTARSNEPQQATISSRAMRDMHGHSVGGWIDSSVVRWVGEYAKAKRQPDLAADDWNQADIPKSVLTAMRAAWVAVEMNELKKYSSDCRGYFRENGCFSLICFGNACDLSIYPDQMYDCGDGAIEFGCHNLDSASQQLTLLAGLAKILELAENN
jgi:hypothetical protein